MSDETKNKNGQKLTLCLESIHKDFFGLYWIVALINGKPYNYCISSEYAVRTIEKNIRIKRCGKALKILNAFNIRENVEVT